MNFAFVEADFQAISSSCFSSLSVSCLSSSSLLLSEIDVAAKPQMAKRSFSDGFWCVKAFGVIFSRYILNSAGHNGHPCHSPTVVRKKSPTLPFSNTVLVASSYNDDLMTSISRLSMSILLRLARCHHARHDRTLYWSWWNYETPPSDVPSAFLPTALSCISVQWYFLKAACSSSKICSA